MKLYQLDGKSYKKCIEACLSMDNEDQYTDPPEIFAKLAARLTKKVKSVHSVVFNCSDQIVYTGGLIVWAGRDGDTEADVYVCENEKDTDEVIAEFATELRDVVEDFSGYIVVVARQWSQAWHYDHDMACAV